MKCMDISNFQGEALIISPEYDDNGFIKSFVLFDEYDETAKEQILLGDIEVYTLISEGDTVLLLNATPLDLITNIRLSHYPKDLISLPIKSNLSLVGLAKQVISSGYSRKTLDIFYQALNKFSKVDILRIIHDDKWYDYKVFRQRAVLDILGGY